MDFSINSKQRKIMNVVRELVQGEFKPALLSSAAGYNNGFNWSLVRRLGEYNLVCPTVPEEYGGRGLSRLTTALVLEEIAAGHPGLAAVIAATLHAVEPILLAGTEEQKQKYLPVLTGANAGLAAFALTEASGGSDLNSMKTCAERRPDGCYYVNGVKDYVINAAVADWITVIASTRPEAGKASLRVLLIDKNSDGVYMGSKRETSGLNYAEISQIQFNDTVLHENDVIKGNEAGSGYLLLTQTFDQGRAMVGAISIGIARAALETALEFAEQRVQFGTILKKHQAISFNLADMATRIEMSRLMVWKACWLIDQGGDYSAASAMAKVAASETAQQVTCASADIMGARGYERGTFMEQLVRDARVLSTIEGTNNMQRLVIASQL
ncbi:MAG TPA: acyl-CoA dehydrogenase family protein [Syntrophomonadaceae bacterium]|nr:acyl-CoA dehydrogenase family protein [Syntrophomonadaceae bacterium]